MRYHRYMYNKIFTKILDSSIWLEPGSTRLVWLTMIAAMDEDGYCQFASVANLSHRARVTMDEATEAVRCLEGADANSSDPEHDGRRIERVPGGWIVLNATKYRNLVTRTVAKEQTRIRVARHREKTKSSNGAVTVCNAEVTASNVSVTPSEAGAEAKTEAEPPLKKVLVRDNKPTTEQAKAFADIFHRRHTSRWTDKEIEAYKKLGNIDQEDLALVARYYAFHWPPVSGVNILRHDLQTFLNHFPGEVDRARNWETMTKRAEDKPTPAQPQKLVYFAPSDT